jgi:hypothetical protein
MTTRLTESPLASFRHIGRDECGRNPRLIRVSPENRSAKVRGSCDFHPQMTLRLPRPLTAAYISKATGAALLVSVICLSFSTLQGQRVTGTISGTVTDASGAVVPDASIVVTSTNTGVTIFNTATDQTGAYSVAAVQPGTYSIEVSDSGFKTDVRLGVVIQVNQNGVDFTLQVGETSQRVEVTAAASLLVTQSAALSNVVDSKGVVNLPLNGRFFTDLPLGEVAPMKDYTVGPSAIAGMKLDRV